MISVSIIEELVPLTKTFNIQITGYIELTDLNIDFMIYEKGLNFMKMIYPAFLQEVIEGINNTTPGGLIIQYPNSIAILNERYYVFKDHPCTTIDGHIYILCSSVIKAKEKAILHWFENNKIITERIGQHLYIKKIVKRSINET